MPVKNDYKPNTRVKSVPYKALVEAADSRLRDPHKAYEFTRRTFKETDKSGIYDNNS
jgi:hypothetical protein